MRRSKDAAAVVAFAAIALLVVTVSLLVAFAGADALGW